MKRGSKKSLVTQTTAAIAFIVVATTAGASPEEPVPFDIKAATGDAALMEFTWQSKLQILFKPDQLARVKLPAIRGTLKPTRALARLLQNSGYHFKWTDGKHAIAIVADEPVRRSGSSSGSSTESSPGSQVSEAPREEVVVSSSKEAAEQEARRRGGAYVITSKQIEQEGYRTLQGVLDSRSQDFRGGATPDTQRGADARSNTAHGSSPNLRGLGSGSTQILINDQRMAAGGAEGRFVDIKNIPLSTVERTDIRPEGAGGKYDVNAVAGVVAIKTIEPSAATDGLRTSATFSSAGHGGPSEYVVSQTAGVHTDLAGVLVSYEFWGVGALAADSRHQAHSDLTSQGGGNFSTIASNPGTIISAGKTYAIPHGQDGHELSPSVFVPYTSNLQDLQKNADVTPEEKRWSLFSSGYFNPTEAVRLSFHALYADRGVQQQGTAAAVFAVVPSTNAFYVDPAGIGGPVRVAYSLEKELGPTLYSTHLTTGNFAASAMIAGPWGWKVHSSIAYAFENQRQTLSNQVNLAEFATALGDSDPETAFNLFGDGPHTNPETIERIRARPYYLTDSSILTFNGRLAGKLLQLPGGPLELELGGSLHRQSFSSEVVGDGWQRDSRFALDSDAITAFIEAQIPLLGKPNKLPGLEELGIRVALRGARDSVIGGAMLPQVELAGMIDPNIGFDFLFSRSFRPPSPAAVGRQTGTIVLELSDPTSPTGTTTSLVQFGNAPDLRAETATSWSAGLDARFNAVPGLLLTFRYFNVVVSNRAESASQFTDLLSNAQYGEIITRHPSALDLQTACRGSETFGMPVLSCLTAPIEAIVDARFAGREGLKTSGIDFAARYELSRGSSKLMLGVEGTHVLAFSRTSGPNEPSQNLLDTPGNPLSRKLRASAYWQGRSGLEGGLSLNFSNAYRDDVSVPNRRIASWTTVDGTFTYSVKPDGVRLSLGATNLFDKAPPFFNNPLGWGYDQENGDLLGRIWWVRFILEQ